MILKRWKPILMAFLALFLAFNGFTAIQTPIRQKPLYRQRFMLRQPEAAPFAASQRHVRLLVPEMLPAL
jgi:hypothetical protein